MFTLSFTSKVVATFNVIILSGFSNASNDYTLKKGRDAAANCNIYLAPSSIEGAGMGVYVTRSFQKGELIMSSDYGNTIPIVDPYVNPNHSKWTRLFNNYVWTQPTGASNDLKYEAETVIDLQLGLGIFPNSHSVLHNLGFTFPKTTYEEESFDSSPLGSGAFTRHKGRNFVASRFIQEGEELFLNYGDSFLDTRPSLSHVPRKNDFVTASNIIIAIKSDLDKIVSLLSRGVIESSMIVDELIENMLTVACKSLPIEMTCRQRICSILPKSLNELQRLSIYSNDVFELYEGSIKDPITFSLALTTIERRDVTWIQSNGVCFDSLFVDKSAIPNAGNGAMSKRSVEKGALIARMPLLQIIDKNVLSTSKVVIGNNKISHDLNQVVGSQLLLNYCFGHKESPLLLCPTSNAIFANHCNESFNCSPNAYFRWSNDNKTKEWLSLSLDDIAEKNEWGLALDLVALRDIKHGEEIFVDYGKEWEEAWNNHTMNVHEQLNHEVYHQQDNINRLNNVFSGCLYWGNERDDEEWLHSLEFDFDIQDWSTIDDHIILNHFAKDGSHYVVGNTTTKTYWPCTIIHQRRHDKGPYDDVCTVRLFQPHWQKPKWIDGDVIPRFLTNYPTSSVKSFRKPYTSNLHHHSAFRHYIGIPGESFPAMRKNKIQKSFSNDPDNASFNIGDRVAFAVDNIGNLYHDSAKVIKVDHSQKEKMYTIIVDDGDTIERVQSSSLRKVTKILYAASAHPYL